MSDYYHQFLASMSGVAQNPHHMQQQQQHPQQQHPHHPQHQQHPHQPMPLHQPHHLPPQHQHPPHQHLHEMMPMPLSLPPHLHQQPAMSMNMGMGPGQGPNQYQSLGFYTGFPEPVMFNAQKAQRNRRKSAPGSEHVKHRRTRSGCYTCRSRRIKCDEKRPICERCKKGKRDCSYPDPKSSKKSSSATGQSSQEASTTSQQASPESSNEDDEEDADQDNKLDTILDDDEAEESASGTADASTPQQFTVTFNDKVRPPLRQSSSTSLLNLKRMASTGGAGQASSAGRWTRQSSETPSIEGKSTSPATSTGTAGSFPQTAHSVGSSEQYYPSASSSNMPTISAADWSHLPQDIRFFLGYFLDNITHFHYCLPTDSDNFIRGGLPALAVRNEPLLYALVAFSAYHYILRDPGAKLQQFLQYYDQSVKLLLGILKRKEKHNLGTLLTVLQLATIEEYLGDWVNLMGHQKAALEMLTDIYTPETAAQTPTSRMVLHWYSRFDVFVGIMGGFETALSRDWFTSIVEYYEERIASDPTSLIYKVEDCSARLRLISLDMSLLYARAQEDDIGGDSAPGAGGGGLAAFPSFAPDETFMREHARILEALNSWKASLDAIVQPDDDNTDEMNDGSPEERKHHPLLVTDFSHAVPLREDDIVDPYQPGILYHGPLFGYTIMSCEWQSIIVMHELQAAQLAMAAMTVTPQPAVGPSPLPQGMTLPEGMALPEGMPLPEGITLPESMSLPAGMSLPEGMSLPAGMKLSEGMKLPEGLKLPEGMALPEGMSLKEGLAAFDAMAGAGVANSGDMAATAAAATAASAAKSSTAPDGPAGVPGGDGQMDASLMSAQMSAGMAGLAKRAYTICQIFETLEMWPASPPGCLIISQAMIAIAALFLPRDSRHHMWIRRKFALIETMGYIFPLTMRMRMSELFNDPSCVQWWLPNSEGFSPILQSVRAFADERNVTAVSAQTENLREIRHIFAKLQIGEGGGGSSVGSGGGGAVDDSDASNRAGSSSTAKPKKGAKGGASAKGKRKGV